MKHTNEMEVVFDSRSENERFARVAVAAFLTQLNPTIHIKDTGCGIADIEKAMMPMYTTKPEMDRSGMGFAFMEAFMDKVEVESAPGKGTIVKMEKTIGKGRASWTTQSL